MLALVVFAGIAALFHVKVKLKGEIDFYMKQGIQFGKGAYSLMGTTKPYFSHIKYKVGKEEVRNMFEYA